MHRSSPSIASLAAALAKAQAELVNPEKSLVATISSGHRGGPEQSFRYAPLSSGLDIVRKTLGQHEIATVQARCNSCSRYNLHDGCPHELWSSSGRVMDAPSSSTLSSRAARGRILRSLFVRTFGSSLSLGWAPPLATPAANSLS